MDNNINNQNTNVESIPQNNEISSDTNKPKSNKKVIIIICVCVGLFVLFFIGRYVLAFNAVKDTLDQSKASVYMNEIKSLMDVASNGFINDTLSGSDGVKYSSVGSNKLNLEDENTNYYIEFDRRGNFVRVYASNENFCFDSGVYSVNDNERFEKSSVNVSNIKSSSKSPADVVPTDTNNGGCANKVFVRPTTE